MLLHEHPAATCPHCGAALLYGVKRETASWKVYRSCDGPDGCGRERMVGRISLADIDHRDEVFEIAEEMTASRPQYQ
jgi:hypothetical protein